MNSDKLIAEFMIHVESPQVHLLTGWDTLTGAS